MRKQKKPLAKRGSFGYILIGTVCVLVILFCIIVITGRLAPVVLGIHAGNTPAMMTMPLFVYCVFADLILLEVIFLLFQPGTDSFFKDKNEDEAQGKKKISTQAIIGFVCCGLLLCSIILAPNVCNVFTEQGVESYVFFKTDSVTWEEVGLYELTFTEESGLELYLHFSKDDKVPMFGTTNSMNAAYREKYGDLLGFACYLKEQANEKGWNFKVNNPELIKQTYKDSAYWAQIEKLIQ